jgi:AraC-like DNA-binding protein
MVTTKVGPLSIYFFLVFFSGILGFLVATILLVFPHKNFLSSLYLAGFLYTFGLLAMNYALMMTDFHVHYPHFWRAFGFASFSFGPFALLYTLQLLNPSRSFHKKDLLLFLPALLHPITLIPFFIQNASEKRRFIQDVLKNPKVITLEQESVLPDGWAFSARILLGVGCVIAQLYYLYRWRKANQLNDNSQTRHNEVLFTWLSWFTAILTLFWLVVVFEIFYNQGSSSNLNKQIVMTISITIAFFSLYLFMRPSILYGADTVENPLIIDPEGRIIPPDEPTVAEKKIVLTEEQQIELKNGLEKYLSETQAFRTPNFSMRDLSLAMDAPAYLISTFINQNYGKNFNEFINDYRVDYLIERSSQPDTLDQFTLEALGKEAGFNSRTAFITAVKKRTGKTPSVLFKRRS